MTDSTLNRRRNRWSLWCLLIGVLALLVVSIAVYLVVRPKWSPSVNRESIRSGERLIEAIDEFHDTNGRYPASLEDLVPSYVKEIPQPTAGPKVWKYHVLSSGGSYQLAFEMPGGYPVYFYDSRYRLWHEDR